MAIIDRVSTDLLTDLERRDLLAWRFPGNELSTWTELIVHESEEAYVVRGGIYDGPFLGGRHVLETHNLPLLTGVIGIPFGGRSPFSAEVWYVNRAINLTLTWGTPDPIQLQDPKFSIMVPLRAFGQYGIEIVDSKKFLLKLVGTLKTFSAQDVKTYLAGALTSRIKQAIAAAIIERQICVLESSLLLEELSISIASRLTPDFAEYGIRLSQFHIASINVPDDDPAVQRLRFALARRAELDILGTNYQQDRSLDILQTAAGNEGTSGQMMGLGLGLGVGVPIGNTVGGAMAELAPFGSGSSGSGQQAPDLLNRLKEAAQLHEDGKIDDEEFKILKAHILGGQA